MVKRKGAEMLAGAANGSGEASAALQLRSATVTAVNKSVSPWTVTVTVGDTSVPDVNLLGWLDPRVGDEVQMLQSGPTLLVLGTVGPGKVYVPAEPPPAPPAPVVPSGDSLETKPYPISAVGSGTWPSQIDVGNWSNASLWQGGAIGQRSYFFYGSKIAAAKGAGMIISGSIFIRRRGNGGVGGAANVRLGGHNLATQPGSAGALSSVANVGSLLKEQGKTFMIPSAIIAGMNAGTIKGLGLEPGALGYLTPDYLIAYPYGPQSEWSGALTLNIRK